MDRIIKAVSTAITIGQKILQDTAFQDKIRLVASEMTKAYQADGKVLFCGNGGSAADAQHLAAELSGRFYKDRPPLYAEALHVNTSYVTAVANDYSYDDIYSRLVRAMGRKGDLLIGISTSGNSRNVINAMEAAKRLGLVTVGMTGKSGGEMKKVCTYLLNVPSDDTPRIQEAHILIGHILCHMVEEELFA